MEGREVDVLMNRRWMKAARIGLAWLGLAALLSHAFAAERTPSTLRLGYFPNLTHAQALYARATGEFEKATGVRIVWTAFNAGPTAIESLFTDAIDVCFVGPSPTINGHIKSRGEKFVIVAGGASGGAGLVLRQDSGIGGEKDFANKTIATPQLGNTQDIAARVWLAEKGYKLRERGGNVSLVPLSNPDQLTMFRKRQIHGAWTVEPWMARLEIEGGGKVFIEEKSLWSDGKYVTTHLVVNKRYLGSHQERVKKLLASLIEVTERINTDKVAAAVVLNEQLKKETGKTLQPEVIQRAMSRIKFTWDPICASLKKSAASAHTVGFFKKPPVLDGIYSLNLLNEVLKERNLPLVEGP